MGLIWITMGVNQQKMNNITSQPRMGWILLNIKEIIIKQSLSNSGFNQQTTFDTSAIGANYSGCGMRMNLPWMLRLLNANPVEMAYFLPVYSQPHRGYRSVEIGSGFQTSSAGKRQTKQISSLGRKTVCYFIDLQIGFILQPDGLFLFPYSWKKETKRAAADE